MNEWMTDWLIGWLTDCWTDWLTDWLTYWITDRPTFFAFLRCSLCTQRCMPIVDSVGFQVLCQSREGIPWNTIFMVQSLKTPRAFSHTEYSGIEAWWSDKITDWLNLFDFFLFLGLIVTPDCSLRLQISFISMWRRQYQLSFTAAIGLSVWQWLLRIFSIKKETWQSQVEFSLVVNSINIWKS